MTYHYENAGFERFQLFCQSLLLPEYPGLQCYPIGQPDGGRDAWHPEGKSVLQVKFKRETDSSEVNAEWMIRALEGEKPKIEKLAANGARFYLMVTNAAGTSHPGAGRIDKVQDWIDNNLPIPGQCLWRTELDARFQRAPSSLKFAYAEMLTGEDGIQLAVEGLFGPQRERQLRAIRAFLSGQYDDDELVKFKQVDLKNSLRDLFVDVPAVVADKSLVQLREQPQSSKETLGERLQSLGLSLHQLSERTIPDRIPRIGAARLLLSDLGQCDFRLAVLQGAPGQGKSTLAQFVCQVHRARYLNKTEFFEGLSEESAGAFRIPFKIDLRDFDAYLARRSPFATELNQRASNPSLEQFIADLVSAGSGGLSFTVDDAVDTLTRSSALLFLDGLDEVADRSSRARLVEAVVQSIRRLEDLGANLQVVVTSRPSLFGDNPDLGRSGFKTIKLAHMNRRLVAKYADKWVVARDLDSADAEDVKKILADKLDLGHIRELTRNPMQLTILLTLINQVGYSLPDARTDLYTQYVDRFLIRESEKTPEVRKHRPELLEFIQYLAWKLQLDAESSKTSGTISKAELQTELTNFLSAHGTSTSTIVEDLFSRGLERVFVLVSRIEGQYEFEVQPLREYFCARYLYETAPVGTYRFQSPMGDRAQRFEAMARNPFWLNTTRFYAGSYDRGELADLVSSLKQLIKAPKADYSTSLQARLVGMALLTDWVFRARRAVQEELIEIVFDEIGIAAASRGAATLDSMQLDEDCGREHLSKLLFRTLTTIDLSYRPYEICALLRVNGGSSMFAEFSAVLEGLVGDDRTEMLARAIYSGAFANVNASDAWDLICVDGPDRAQLFRRCAGLHDYERHLSANSPEIRNCLITEVLDGRARALPPIDGLSTFSLLHEGADRSFHRFHLAAMAIEETPWTVQADEMTVFDQTVNAFLAHLRNRLQAEPHVPSREEFQWARSIVEASRESFGESWASYVIALRAAGIGGKEHRGIGANRLFDASVALCDRARFARLHRGGSNW